MRVGETEFIFKTGDITSEQADVIVNAANSALAGGGGVDGAIHRAGGPDIAAECEAIAAAHGRVAPGDAVVTAAGNLKAQHVIHTVGPIWNGGKKNEAQTLKKAYDKSLQLAKEHNAKTIAFPAISTGAYGYPKTEAAEIALRACAEFCQEHPGLREIRFVLFSNEDLGIYRKTAAALGPA